MTARGMAILIGGWVAAGCTAQIAGAEGAARSWELVADDQGGLVDRRNPELGSYPNSLGSERLAVRLMADGRLCASDGGTEFCGGPLDGIPYTTRAVLDGGRMCMRVVDLYGNETDRICRDALPAELRAEAEPLCWNAFTAAGGACQVCADAEGNLTSNTCVTGADPDGPADEESSASEDSERVQAIEAEPLACAGGDGAVLAGATLVVEVINEGLARMQIQATLPAPASVDELAGYDPSEIALAGGVTCDAVLAESDRRFGEDGPGDEDYVFGDHAIRECLRGGECRIGQLVSRSMAEACNRIAAGCDVDNTSLGIIMGGGQAIGELCGPGRPDEIHECRGSPLALDLAGDGLALAGREGGVSFPLMGGAPVRTGWLRGAGDDGWLAIDRDGDGAIGAGGELFGEVTDGWAPDGFAALARHDGDGDGWITAADEVWPALLVWLDDGDGTSGPGELLGLEAAGVAALPVHARALGTRDPFGNELGLVAEARGTGGAPVTVIDVWLAFGP